MEVKIITIFEGWKELKKTISALEECEKHHPDAEIKAVLFDEGAYKECVEFMRNADFFIPPLNSGDQKSS